METKKISPSRQKKEQIVAKLAERAAKAKGLVFANYQGLTHQQLEGLKKAIKSLQAELVVTKNTLLKLALLNSKHETRNSKQYQNSNDKNSKHLSLSDFGFRISDFQGPTATLFLYGDPIEPLKQLTKTIVPGGPAIKFGFLDKQLLTSEQVMKLAALPSRNVLIAQIIFQMKAPLYGLHRAMEWNLTQLVITLKAIEGKKS